MKRSSQKDWTPPASESSSPFGEFFEEVLGYQPDPAVQAEDASAGPGETGPRFSGQMATLQIERKGRRGKTVTLVNGLQAPREALEELTAVLRQACGAGGTLAGATIEIQGDQRDRVEERLTGLGIKVKRSGG